MHALLETVRERSIEARASALVVPDLMDAELVRQGAGNYDAMCTGCHLAPGMAPTELSKGLYPQPPAFATATPGDPKHDFWVIKHGIKASGMPAWGKSMDDEYIWNMAAFLQELPRLNAAQYQAMVASSEGHSHGGGETKPHAHAEGVPDDHDDRPGKASPVKTTSDPAPDMVEHRHADGTVESHPAPQPTQADDGHDHEH